MFKGNIEMEIELKLFFLSTLSIIRLFLWTNFPRKYSVYSLKRILIYFRSIFFLCFWPCLVILRMLYIFVLIELRGVPIFTFCSSFNLFNANKNKIKTHKDVNFLLTIIKKKMIQTHVNAVLVFSCDLFWFNFTPIQNIVFIFVDFYDLFLYYIYGYIVKDKVGCVISGKKCVKDLVFFCCWNY